MGQPRQITWAEASFCPPDEGVWGYTPLTFLHVRQDNVLSSNNLSNIGQPDMT